MCFIFSGKRKADSLFLCTWSPRNIFYSVAPVHSWSTERNTMELSQNCGCLLFPGRCLPLPVCARKSQHCFSGDWLLVPDTGSRTCTFQAKASEWRGYDLLAVNQHGWAGVTEHWWTVAAKIANWDRLNLENIFKFGKYLLHNICKGCLKMCLKDNEKNLVFCDSLCKFPRLKPGDRNTI